MFNKIKEKNFFKISFLILILLLLTIAPVKAALEVHFIDVGQGDSILIQEDKKTNILIDGGDRWNSVEDKVLSYLRENGVKTLDALVSTHAHSDHIGTLEAVINNFNVSQVYDPGKIHTSKTFENYLIAIDQNNIPFSTPGRGDEFLVGNLKFKVLNPKSPVEDYSLNNSSLVLRLEYEEVSFLFTGDIEKEVEKEIIAANLKLDSNILKVAHHGSKTSSTNNFIDKVSPEVAVITVGEDNKFGHPDRVRLSALKRKNIKVYRTDKNGDIIIKTDGKNYSVKTDKKVVKKEIKINNSASDKGSLININTASKNKLDSLWGIGPVTADKIINYRKNYGPFKSTDEIKNVDGIDEKKFNKWKNKITI